MWFRREIVKNVLEVLVWEEVFCGVGKVRVWGFLDFWDFGEEGRWGIRGLKNWVFGEDELGISIFRFWEKGRLGVWIFGFGERRG